jgi:RNA-directed DNA polymerase
MFEEIISLENLFKAWNEFQKDKAKRSDVLEFEMRLEDNVFQLHKELASGKYKHGNYFSFFIQDPKRRHVHKALVRDRLLHHAIVRKIEPIFERTFIYDSWSCRKGKGTHAAVRRLRHLAGKASLNNTKLLWALKLDIKKFFDSIDHEVLITLVKGNIDDSRLISLIENIINSFSPGLPLGNLTSQLMANVYMDKLDQFVKHELKAKYYLRYADDFILLSTDKGVLKNHIFSISKFLKDNLKLSLHENKIILRKYRSGIDFLGYVCFPDYCVLRTKTKKRIFRKLAKHNVTSYLGVLSHCRSFSLSQRVKMLFHHN